jgi:hypothetical protein
LIFSACSNRAKFAASLRAGMPLLGTVLKPRIFTTEVAETLLESRISGLTAASN